MSIGTDSVASNNSLNFFEEMKVFAMASKMYYKDPTAVTPQQTLYAATRAGALSQGREDKVAELQAEIAILESYLPKQMSAEEVAATTKQVEKNVKKIFLVLQTA